jgi:hypothetical protein
MCPGRPGNGGGQHDPDGWDDGFALHGFSPSFHAVKMGYSGPQKRIKNAKKSCTMKA